MKVLISLPLLDSIAASGLGGDGSSTSLVGFCGDQSGTLLRNLILEQRIGVLGRLLEPVIQLLHALPVGQHFCSSIQNVHVSWSPRLLLHLLFGAVLHLFLRLSCALGELGSLLGL